MFSFYWYALLNEFEEPIVPFTLKIIRFGPAIADKRIFEYGLIQALIVGIAKTESFLRVLTADSFSHYFKLDGQVIGARTIFDGIQIPKLPICNQVRNQWT